MIVYLTACLVVLPFADLVLLASNSATAIVTSACFSICLLGEKFMWKYDLTALFLIILGNTLTIVQSNKLKDTRDINEITTLFESVQTFVFFIMSLLLYCFTGYLIYW